MDSDLFLNAKDRESFAQDYAGGMTSDPQLHHDVTQAVLFLTLLVLFTAPIAGSVITACFRWTGRQAFSILLLYVLTNLATTLIFFLTLLLPVTNTFSFANRFDHAWLMCFLGYVGSQFLVIFYTLLTFFCLHRSVPGRKFANICGIPLYKRHIPAHVEIVDPEAAVPAVPRGSD